jgi:polyprenyl P-hydroxybenzoate/phenylacrylic acid decarboxylase-like protein
MLQVLHERDDVEVHLVMSRGARKSIRAEMDSEPEIFEKLADVVHGPEDMGASISSGSFVTIGMTIIPCSMHTLAEVATGVSGALISRAADVCLKERRPLVLVTRETPLNLIHIRNMETVTLAGATVLPPMPAFYHRPASIQDLLLQTVGKVLDQFHLEHELFRRWTGAADSC